MLAFRGCLVFCKRANPQLRGPEENMNGPKTAKASAVQSFTCTATTLHFAYGQCEKLSRCASRAVAVCPQQ